MPCINTRLRPSPKPPLPCHLYNEQDLWRRSQGDLIPVCGHLQVGSLSYSCGLARDSTQSTVHSPGTLPGDLDSCLCLYILCYNFNYFSSASFFASQSLQARFRGKNKRFGARKSWVESQDSIYINWALGLRTSYFSSLSLRSINVKGGTVQSKWGDVCQEPGTQ